jgi:hypothetical protein
MVIRPAATDVAVRGYAVRREHLRHDRLIRDGQVVEQLAAGDLPDADLLRLVVQAQQAGQKLTIGGQARKLPALRKVRRGRMAGRDGLAAVPVVPAVKLTPQPLCRCSTSLDDSSSRGWQSITDVGDSPSC